MYIYYSILLLFLLITYDYGNDFDSTPQDSGGAAADADNLLV